MYVNGYKTKRYTHKIYININVYQTNSPLKLVTSKTFFPLTWSSPPKFITPPEERHSILKFLPIFDIIFKGLKRPKDLIRDRLKVDIKGMRRTRNHRPTRKRETRCYGHKGRKCETKKLKCMQGYLDQSRKCQESIEKKPTSSSYWASRNFLDGSSGCRAAIEIESQESRWIEIAITAIKKGSSKGSIDSLAIERYWEVVKIA